jgi:hypothetical protein
MNFRLRDLEVNPMNLIRIVPAEGSGHRHYLEVNRGRCPTEDGGLV